MTALLSSRPSLSSARCANRGSETSFPCQLAVRSQCCRALSVVRNQAANNVYIRL